jgi:hypothetical protein
MKLHSFSEYLLLEKLKKVNKQSDTYLAYKFANLIRTDFNRWPAYKIGLIDNQGNVIRIPKEPHELKHFGLFEDLVRKIKRALVKYAGKSNVLTNLISLYILQKESYCPDSNKLKLYISEQLTNDEIELVESILMEFKDKIKEYV